MISGGLAISIRSGPWNGGRSDSGAAPGLATHAPLARRYDSGPAGTPPVLPFARRGQSATTAALLVSKLEDLELDDGPACELLLDKGREWFDAYAVATHCEIPLKTLSVDDWRVWRNELPSALSGYSL